MCISGSGSTFIYGYKDANWQPGMSLDEAKQFIKSAISLACYRDGSSGGIIRMVSITEAGIERFLIPYQDFDIKWAIEFCIVAIGVKPLHQMNNQRNLIA